MAERKRAFTEDDAEQQQSPPKRAKNASAPSFVPSKDDIRNPPSLPNKPVTASGSIMTPEQIAAKRAEIASKIAKFNLPGMNSTKGSSLSIPPPPSESAPSVPPPPPGMSPEIARRVAEAKRKAEAMATQESGVNPYLPSTSSKKNDDNMNRGIHPLLANLGEDSTESNYSKQSYKNRYKPMAPKFATTSVNAKLASTQSTSQQPKPEPKPGYSVLEDVKDNPYFDRRLGGIDSMLPKDRKTRNLKFVQKGKYTQLADKIRAEHKMEELKRKILESAKKVGLEEDIDERQAKRPPPPEVEWWDVPFLPGDTYNDVGNESSRQKIYGENSAITLLVQHPIAIPSPKDRHKVEEKPLMLTKKEMKKMRRQRRKADLQDKQDRVRMGLLRPDPPKVKLSNMMRVLTQEAVADPTKIEARVRRDMMARKLGHERANAERKLTDDQRREKIEKKKETDAAKGIVAAAFKIRYLHHPSHKFKVRKNAEQHGLTGVTIYNPKFALILVEGGEKGINKYRHLMLNRIDWTEQPADNADDDIEQQEQQKDDGGEPINMSENKCELIWQGQYGVRRFLDFRPKACPTDKMAKEFLGTESEGVWNLAKQTKEGTITV